MQAKNADKAAKSQDVDFLLTSKVICGCCKGTMRSTSGTGKSGRKFYYYACHNKIYKHAECAKKNVNKEWLENEVTRLTVEYILTDEIIDFIADNVVKIWGRRTIRQINASLLRKSAKGNAKRT